MRSPSASSCRNPPRFFSSERDLKEEQIAMKLSAALLLCSLTAVLAASRSKRAAYELPDGADLIVGGVRTTFRCSQEGYYADVDNNCQIFHVCHTAHHPDGHSEMMQWSFFCGNQTVFNQFSFTCSYPEDAVPCAASNNFFYLNANLGAGPNVPFHTEQDVARAAQLTPGRSAQPSFVAQPQARPQPPRGRFPG